MSSSVKVDLDLRSGLDPNTLTRASKTQNSGAGVVNTNKYAFPILTQSWNNPQFKMRASGHWPDRWYIAV